MKLVWDQVGDKTYETGVSKGVLYLQNASGAYPTGVAWNGLTKVTESPSGAESTKLYADNTTYLNLMSAETFGATIEAYTYPKEFEACDGSAELAPGVTIGQQTRKTFGMAYVTIFGNDTEMEDHGYKIHLVYGALASPSEKEYDSVNDTPAAISFSWEISTTPVTVPGYKPTATLVIDSTLVAAEKLTAIEDLLFGTEANPAKLPLPSEIITLLAA